MANQEQLKILAKGVDRWNTWRIKHAKIAVDLTAADLRGADLGSANLSGCDLSGAALTKANLGRATLIGADLSNTRLGSADLSDAYLNDADLSGAEATSADLNGADLRYADMSNAVLIDCDLIGSDLSNARLDGADLEAAAAAYCNLAYARLTSANLAGSDLRYADLTGAHVRAANFARTIMKKTLLRETDLGQAIGLESVKHTGPSTISLDTIYRSHSQIPESFLRGAGVPENFITYMKSLTGAAFDFYSCFISYSTHDQDFADRLYADLQARGVRCWFAPHDIQGGRKLHEQIDEAIRVYDKLLLILSDASMSSPWVKTEIANARAREQQQGRQMLFPIALVPFEQLKAWKCFDAGTGIDSAREIREYFVPDFSKWKEHDSYHVAFERLVRDLKAQSGENAAAQRLP
jgi:uncharacterized protein YjbI with pentapeptide repeats